MKNSFITTLVFFSLVFASFSQEIKEVLALESTSGLPDLSSLEIDPNLGGWGWSYKEPNTYVSWAMGPWWGSDGEYQRYAQIKANPDGTLRFSVNNFKVDYGDGNTGAHTDDILYQADITPSGYNVVANNIGLGSPTGSIRIQGSPTVFVQNEDGTFSIENGTWQDWVNIAQDAYGLGGGSGGDGGGSNQSNGGTVVNVPTQQQLETTTDGLVLQNGEFQLLPIVGQSF